MFSDRAKARLSVSLEPDERVVAWGRVDALRSPSEVPRGSAYSFIAVTPSRVLWIGHECVETLPFDIVSSFSDGLYQHRYVLLLHHATTTRIEWVPKHRVLWWEWGNASAALPATEVAFEFSRANTEAAKAIRSQLRRYEVPFAGQLALPAPPPREVGTFLRATRWGLIRHRLLARLPRRPAP